MMLTSYIEAAMRHARCEILEDDGSHYCEIPVCPGVWSNADTFDEANAELRDVLEAWIALGLAHQDRLPIIDGTEISIQTVR